MTPWRQSKESLRDIFKVYYAFYLGGFQIEDESTVTEVPNSYQQGHSVTYVQQKFNFLESNLDTSVAELKEERNPDEIRKETNGQFFEAETPEKSKKSKKRYVKLAMNALKLLRWI